MSTHKVASRSVRGVVLCEAPNAPASTAYGVPIRLGSPWIAQRAMTMSRSQSGGEPSAGGVNSFGVYTAAKWWCLQGSAVYASSGFARPPGLFTSASAATYVGDCLIEAFLISSSDAERSCCALSCSRVRAACICVEQEGWGLVEGERGWEGGVSWRVSEGGGWGVV